MRWLVLKYLPILFCFVLAAQLHAAKEPKLDPLPVPLSNNAVAISHDGGKAKIFSFMGMGAAKDWKAITNRAFEMDPGSGEWMEKRPVPGMAGRVAASAIAIHDQVFIFGGYIVDSDGGETTVSDLNVYVPFEDRYYRGKDIPVPVDDAVIGLFHDRYIFLIGGWSSSKGEAVRNVQIYDTDKDVWMQGTVELWATRLFMSMVLIRTLVAPVQSMLRRVSAGWGKFLKRRRLTLRRLNGRNFRSIRGVRVIALRRARGRRTNALLEFISQVGRIILTT
jgi:hypothetical protein